MSNTNQNTELNKAFKAALLQDNGGSPVEDWAEELIKQWGAGFFNKAEIVLNYKNKEAQNVILGAPAELDEWQIKGLCFSKELADAAYDLSGDSQSTLRILAEDGFIESAEQFGLDYYERAIRPGSDFAKALELLK